MRDEVMDNLAFRIQCAVMAQFGLYWSPAGWMTREEWQQFNMDDGEVDID